MVDTIRKSDYNDFALYHIRNCKNKYIAIAEAQTDFFSEVDYMDVKDIETVIERDVNIGGYIVAIITKQ